MRTELPRTIRRLRGTVFALGMMTLLSSAAPGVELAWESLDAPYGGRVRGLHATADGILLAGTGSGVFRSDDQGATWRDVNDRDMRSQDVGTVVLADGVLYAGCC